MPELKVEEDELEHVIAWAREHALSGMTEHEEGTYEEGVFDGIRWVLGMISVRPDSP